ncbi:hypothetical protein RCL1_006346 [Eukaryota sp. TZLM3-RCL]
MSSVGGSIKSGASGFQQNWKNDGFGFASQVHSSTDKHNTLTKVLFFVEILQIIGIVINKHFPFIHQDLDPRGFLHGLQFAGYDPSENVWSPFSRFVLTISLGLLPLVFILLFVVGSYLLRNGRSVSGVAVFSKSLLEIFSALFFLPLTITAFTWVQCSDSSTFVSVSVAQCWTPEYIFYRSLLFLSWIGLLCVALFKESMFVDISLASKRVFSGLDRRFNIYFLGSKVVFAFLLTLFDHLPFVFLVCYPAILIALTVFLVKTVPYYKQLTNGFVGFLMGSTSTIAVIWFISKLAPVEAIPLWFFTLFLYIFPVFVGLFVRKLCVFRHGYFAQTIPLSLNMSCSDIKYSKFLWMKQSNLIDSTPKSVALSDSEDEELTNVVRGPGIESVSPSIFAANLLKNPYNIEKYFRFLTRGIPEEELTFCRTIISESLSLFPTSAPVYLFKSLVELFFVNDPISAMSTCLSFTNLDIDIRLDSAFFAHYCRVQADNLRRTQSTGQNLDNNSYLLMSRSLKSAVDLHKDVLDYLCAFWTVLMPKADKEPELAVLPSITNQVYSAKIRAENAFNKLVTQHPGNKDVLLAYSAFAREVCLDDDLADNLQAQCDLSASDRQSDGASSSHLTNSTSLSHRKKQRRRRNAAMIMTLTDNGDSQVDKTVASKLSKSVNLSLSLLLIICIVSFIFIRSGFSSIQNEYSFAFEISHLGSSAMKVASNLFYLSASTAHSIKFGNQTVDDYRNDVISESFHGNFHLNRLLVGSEISPTPTDFDCSGFRQFSTVSLSVMNSFSFLLDPVLSRLDSSTTIPSVPNVRFVSLANLALDYFRRAVIYARNETNSIPSDVYPGSDAHFLFTNREVLQDASQRLLELVKDEALDDINMLMLTNSIVVVLIVAIIVCMALILFARTLSEIVQRKNEIFNLFLYLPRKHVKAILADPKFADVSINKKRALIPEDDSTEQPVQSIKMEEINQNVDIQARFVGDSEEDQQVVISVDQDDDVISSKSDSSAAAVISNGWKLPVVILFLILASSLMVLSIMDTNDFDSGVQTLINRNSEINSILDNSFVLLEHGILSSSALLSFANSGDLRFYHQYLDYRYSTTRPAALSELRRSDISTQNLEILSRNIYRQALIDYKDLIALKIIQFAYGYSDYDMPEVAQFTYDVTKESQFRRETVDFSFVGTWYTDSITDSQLDSTELIALARGILSNRRHSYIEGDRSMSLKQFSEAVTNRFLTATEELKQSNEFEGFMMILIPSVTGVLILLIILFTMKFMTPATTTFKNCLLVSSVAVVILFVFSIIFSIATVSSFKNLSEILDTSNEIDMNLTQLIESNIYLSYSSQLFSQEAEVIHYSMFEQLRGYLSAFVENFGENSAELTALLGSSWTNLIDEIIDFRPDYYNLRTIESISIALAALADQVPESLVPVVTMTWNLTNQSNFNSLITEYSYIDWTRFYSDDAFDKTLPDNQKFDISRGILTSDIYRDSLIASSNRLRSISTTFRQSTVDLLSSSLDTLSVRSNTLMLLFGLLSASLMLSCYFVFMTYKRTIKRKSHVKQVIPFAVISRLSLQYKLALGLLAICVVGFFAFSIYALIESIPIVENVEKASTRLLLAHELEGSVALLLDPHQELNYLQNRLLILSESEILINLHLSLLFGRGISHGSIGIDLEQDRTSLLTNYNLESEFSSSGLHVNLEHFVSLARRIATVPTMITDSSVDFQSFIAQSKVISDYLYKSLYLFRDFALNNVKQTLTIVVTIFILLLLLLVLEYIFVYRKMINTLSSEEETVLLVLSMLPSEVIDSVGVIKNYLDSIGV